MTSAGDNLRDTGRTIGATTDTAAFVRAQMARGVSAETLRRNLGIRAGDMLDMLVDRAPEPPLPEPRAERIDARGGNQHTLAMRAKAEREKALTLLNRVLPIVAEITGASIDRILKGASKPGDLRIRSLVFGLMYEIRPDLPNACVSWAASVSWEGIDGARERCAKLRNEDGEYARWYLRALSRLAP